MSRYKRGRGRRRSTNMICMKFQSFMDISTNDSSMQIITISAGGKEILNRLAPQFGAYKYWRLGKISAKLVPASTLPVDPTGLSITAGDNLVDPRDQLTPGMMRITNGEDVFEDITGLSADKQHAIYNNMLLDPRWFKWMLQSGVKRYGYPRYWQIGQLHQDKWPGAITNLPRFGSLGITGTDTEYEYTQRSTDTLVSPSTAMRGGSSPYGFFQTGHKGVLGWLPTDGLQHFVRLGADGGESDTALITSPPEIEVMKILLPKAFKTRYWYRLFITEEVWFREPIVNFGIGVDELGTMTYYRPLDVFHDVTPPVPSQPWQGRVAGSPTDAQTGGNYGDS